MDNANIAELPTKDEEYWIPGDFIAENVLFRAPSAQFTQNSVVFAAMLDLPQGKKEGDVDDHEGRSDKRPIIFPPPVTAMDFRRLLKALYPKQHVVASKQIPPGLSKEELMSILKLSTMWYFLSYREQAIEQLSSLLGPVEKITTGRQYKILRLLRTGFQVMITRYTPIDDDEAVLIGPMTAVRLYRAREKYKAYSSKEQQAINFHVFLAERFGPELESIGLEELGYSASNSSQT